MSLFLIGCGGGGGSSSDDSGFSIISKTLTGTAIDGYISGATVCLDINENDICDNSEPNTTTASDGTFTLDFNTTVGSKSIIMIGGIDTATNKIFTGVLKDIVDVDDTNASISTKITPLTTIAANIYKEEKLFNTNYKIDTAKQTLADNIGITKAQVDADPMLNRIVFTKTQQIIQTTKLLQSSIQKDESNSTKNDNAFNHIMKQIALSIKGDNSSDINIPKIITKLENTTYENVDINISDDVEIYIEGNKDDIDLKVQSTSIYNLDKMQKGFDNNTDIAKNDIQNDTTNNLAGNLNNNRIITTNLILQSVNNIPVITSNTNITVNENQLSVISISAIDTDNDTLIYLLT
ncbi:MAG: hypothetical protein KAJ49_10210, partial [Arcobacteraceae bacterium]|nr:hypothetical protein [Arcobacteraceae bacterium]